MEEKNSETRILTENDITFGKYKDLTLTELLKDREYCSWLLKQEWFQRQYEYLYNRVKMYIPVDFFVKPKALIWEDLNKENFLEYYKYFNLYGLEELKISLSDTDKVCYNFYISMIENLKDKIVNNKYVNRFDIKAPISWLSKFEKNTGLSRDVFKEFLKANDLQNIPYIVEDIKKMGGIEYNGARSFLIAKEKSLSQEKYWEGILKDVFGEDISVQYKLEKFFFDFIHVKSHTLYECKLGLKDFNIDQHNKYMMTEKLPYASLVYLIGRDCIINIKNKTIYTTNVVEYSNYISKIDTNKKATQFDNLIKSFDIKDIVDVRDYFKEMNK